ncbi:lysine biosynthesis protein LysW [Streptomyces sp. NBC_00388]|uniref:lysine biosynthesis protein LysW n=1 Tax=Streptomyces sp. NBC_00388 TaxID=2975735 RepID=UPI002E1BD55C
MSTATHTGICPECETDLTVPPIGRGETLSCPECLLTLRVESIADGQLTLQMIEVQLRDWGQ